MVTTTLQVLGQLVFDFNLSIAQILVSIGTCAAIELTITFRRTKVIAWPASAMLTGNGIALIMRVPGTEHGDWWSLHGWWVFAGTAAFAMATKYLIRVKGSNVFNPSNVALVVAFVVLGEQRADPQVLWWGPLSPGLVLAFAVILAGSIAITRRVRQGHSAVSFWVVFAALTAVIAASGHSITTNWHVGPVAGWDYWVLLVTSPEILVFLFFMITDPKTAPAGRVAQAVYGTGIAVSAALIVSTQNGEFGTKVGILAGLVILCPFVRLIAAHTPTPRTEADRLRTWLPGTFGAPIGTPTTARADTALPTTDTALPTTSTGVRRAGRVTRTLGATLGTTLLVAVLVGFGGRSPAETADLSRRAEVTVDPDDVPTASVDPASESASTRITQEMADAMAADLALDLAIEARAFATGDADLAAAGLGGIRLDQTVAAIRAAGGPSDAPTVRLDEVTATMVRTRPGPQAPPELALHAVGTKESADGDEPFEGTYVLAPVGGVHLVVDELDEHGEPMGDRSVSPPANAIEAALEPEPRPATDDQLGGLVLRDVTEQVGLSTPRSDAALREGPAAWSGGAAAGDYDGDGDVDLYLTRHGAHDVLYRNDDGRFVDVTGSVGLPVDAAPQARSTSTAPASTGALWVDLDGDTRLDLVVLGLGDVPNRVLRNDPNGTFADVSDRWSLPTGRGAGPDASHFSVAAGDYDRDGYVDLVVADADPYPVMDAAVAAGAPGGAPCDVPRPSPETGGSRTALLRNTGDGFEDRTDLLGAAATTPVPMTSRFVDLDGDGWDDLVIAGHACTSTVLRNDGAGGFEDVTEGSGFDEIENGVGLELLDVDRDGRLDVFVTGISYPTASGGCPVLDPLMGCSGNRLLLNSGELTFRDVTDEHGVRDSAWGTGSAAVDLNLDGLTDLMVASGFHGVVADRPDDGSAADRPFYRRGVDSADRLWLGVERGALPDAAAQVGLTGSNGKAVVPFDHDGDGRVDLLVIDTDGPPRLLRNETTGDRSWLTIRLRDTTSANTSAIGATVEVRAGDGALRQVARVSADGSFQSGRPTDVHAGLGDHDTVDSITVRWPDGTTTELDDVPVKQLLRIDKASSG